jgi:hypothetical protein
MVPVAVMFPVTVALPPAVMFPLAAMFPLTSTAWLGVLPTPSCALPPKIKAFPPDWMVVALLKDPPNSTALLLNVRPLAADVAPALRVTVPLVDVDFTFKHHTTDVLTGRVSVSPPEIVWVWFPSELEVVAATSTEWVCAPSVEEVVLPTSTEWLWFPVVEDPVLGTSIQWVWSPTQEV